MTNVVETVLTDVAKVDPALAQALGAKLAALEARVAAVETIVETDLGKAKVFVMKHAIVIGAVIAAVLLLAVFVKSHL